jgi:hypothetical protein
MNGVVGEVAGTVLTRPQAEVMPTRPKAKLLLRRELRKTRTASLVARLAVQNAHGQRTDADEHQSDQQQRQGVTAGERQLHTLLARRSAPLRFDPRPEDRNAVSSARPRNEAFSRRLVCLRHIGTVRIRRRYALS